MKNYICFFCIYFLKASLMLISDQSQWAILPTFSLGNAQFLEVLIIFRIQGPRKAKPKFLWCPLANMCLGMEVSVSATEVIILSVTHTNTTTTTIHLLLFMSYIHYVLVLKVPKYKIYFSSNIWQNYQKQAEMAYKSRKQIRQPIGLMVNRLNG